MPLRPLLLSALAVGLAVPAAAQTFSAAPANGTGTLRPDGEYARDLTLPAIPASDEMPPENAGGCTGTFTLGRPEANLRVEGRARPLRIYARSSSDTVLMVRSPAGEWSCNDDTDGVNPAVMYDMAQPGTYHVWVGLFFNTGEATPVTLYANGGEAFVLDHAGRPSGGSAELDAGFRPDPRAVEIEVGTDLTIPECPGFYSAAPSFNLNYGGQGPLFVYARADSTADEMDDLVLAVNLPDGTWACNDDAEGLNPGLRFERAMAGLYGVWVGSFRSRARTEAAAGATLFLSETTGPDPEAMVFDDEMPFDEPFPEGYSGGDDLMRDAPPSFGTLSYGGGAAGSTSVQAGGAALNSVIGMGCTGFLNPAAPTAWVEYGGGAERLTIWAQSEVDATLVVGLPDGGWTCNDDYDGLMPAVVLEGAAPGRYPVWVGTFLEEEATAATLHVSGGMPFDGR